MAKILIVDDEQTVLIAFQEELERIGHHVDIAADPREAIELVKKNKYEIIYTDLIMPKMNGVELCKEIKKLTNYPTVVLISGYAKKVLKYKLDFILAGGYDEFLMKPLAENELVRKTEKILMSKK